MHRVRAYTFDFCPLMEHTYATGAGVLWALREVPNATTGVSPYMLVYGRVPRGPLAVLKETWAGERELPPGLGKPVEEYLQDLRDKLGTAAQYATDHSGKQQAGYVGPS